METNPFTFLSYVGGPALLTNASALLLLSTTNRFARAVDRSRELMARVTPPPPDLKARAEYQEIFEVRRRVAQIAGALSCLYLAAAMFGLATLLSIVGAVVAEITGGAVLAPIIAVAAASGAIGFAAFVAAGIILVIESRLALKSLRRESDAALAALRGAMGAR